MGPRRGERQVEQQAQGLRRDDRADDVRCAGRELLRQRVVGDPVGKHLPFSDHVAAIQERRRRFEQRLTGDQHADAERRQHLVKRKRQIVGTKGAKVT